MYRKKTFIFILIIALLYISFNTVLPKRVAHADCSGAGPIEITAGTSGSASATVYNPFTGQCTQGAIDSGLPGLYFDGSNNGGGNSCDYDISPTYSYDATALTGITSDQTYYFSVTGGSNSGGECVTTYDSVEVIVHPSTPPAPSFSLACSPATQTVDVGNSTSFSMSTTGYNTFTSGVTFGYSITPSSGTPPTVSFSNNGAVPNATTTAVVHTSNSTTAGTYTINFTGTGGGISQNCSSQVIVNGPPPGFSFTVTPGQASISKGENAVFAITPDCIGGFNGTISNLSATSGFSNVSYSFSAASVTCGGSVNLTIGNTGSVPSGQRSPYGGSASYQTITITGEGN